MDGIRRPVPGWMPVGEFPGPFFDPDNPDNNMETSGYYVLRFGWKLLPTTIYQIIMGDYNYVTIRTCPVTAQPTPFGAIR